MIASDNPTTLATVQTTRCTRAKNRNDSAARCDRDGGSLGLAELSPRAVPALTSARHASPGAGVSDRRPGTRSALLSHAGYDSGLSRTSDGAVLYRPGKGGISMKNRSDGPWGRSPGKISRDESGRKEFAVVTFVLGNSF